jgi:hypothetical protein
MDLRTRVHAAMAAFAVTSCIAVSHAAVPILAPVPGGEPVTTAAGTKALPVRLDLRTLFSLPPGGEAEVTLPNGNRQGYVFERTVSHGGGITTWIARGADNTGAHRAILTTSAAGTWGWMSTPYGKYRVEPSALGDLLSTSRRVELAPREGGDAVLASDDPPGLEFLKGRATPLAASALPSDLSKSTPSDPQQVDVMFVYTVDLANKLGAGLMPMLYNLVASANQAYADSEIALSLRLVYATPLDLPNSYGSLDVLNAMAGGSADATLNNYFSTLTYTAGSSVRDQVGADVVALVRDGPSDTGGIGFLLSNPTPYSISQPGVVTQTIAYSVSNFCASGCEVIVTHEIGHNMGDAHDRATVAYDNNGTVPSTPGVFSYSLGHYACANGLTCDPTVFPKTNLGGCSVGRPDCANRTPNDFGSVMSYFGPQLLRFSNPNLTCIPPGGSTGAFCGSAQDDNARSMNTVRKNLSAYRNQVVTALPGSVQFDNTSYSAAEATGNMAIHVTRTSGNAGAVSVQYAVTGVSATSGLDFTASTGTLSWPAGDGTARDINIPLVNDLAPEGIESLRVTLSNPVGPAGFYLGWPTVATGLITEPWPPSGTMPAGYVNAAASSSAWAVANDSSFEGDGVSLKSGALNFGVKNCNDAVYGAIPCPSILEYANTFAAGTLSFAYRVSGFPGYGFIEFLVDGAVLMSTSGDQGDADSGWQTFSTPLTAGAHTLQWRYRTRFSFDCKFASNGGSPLYPGCLDRAWIDAISLPLPKSVSGISLASNLNPSSVGQPVTLTATVTASGATGSVLFFDGGVPLAGCAAVPLAGLVAQCQTAALAPGSHSIMASYSGNTAYTPASVSIVEVVTSGPSLLTASPTSVPFGGHSMNTTSPAANIVFTNTSGGAVTPTGVSVSSGYVILGNGCTATLAAGASCTVTVAFAPTAAGEIDGVVSVTYAGAGPSVALLFGMGERSLTTHFYEAVLRRAPDLPGKIFWDNEATRVGGLGANVNETWYAMAMSFFNSPEYLAFGRDNNGFVTDLYNTFFNRAPDGAGLAFWTSQLTAGVPREVVLAGFMFSPEFASFTQAIFGNTGVRAEMDAVVDFYRGLLSRLPDSGGFNFWVGQFRTAQCANAGAVYTQVESISSSFMNGSEYVGKGRSNAQFVGDMYNTFLRRGGDQGGVQFWINQLNGNTLTRNQVRQNFIASPEFTNRVNAIVNQGCFT